ncbi:MAG: hypothetical protein E7046_05410 [Lentisphaerae bacterium]|nr:hypothetical protein [Lentisphaerota bacterium]
MDSTAEKNNWIHLAGCDWSQLLQFQPRFADKCDWSKLDGEDWAMLLRRQPRFIWTSAISRSSRRPTGAISSCCALI